MTKNQKTNWPYVLIVLVLAAAVGAGIFFYQRGIDQIYKFRPTINFNAASAKYLKTPPSNNKIAPVVNSLNPSFGRVGSMVKVSGSGFLPGGNTINFNSGSVNATFINPNNLSFTVPATLRAKCTPGTFCPLYVLTVTNGKYNVSVSNSNGTSNAVVFTVTST